MAVRQPLAWLPVVAAATPAADSSLGCGQAVSGSEYFGVAEETIYCAATGSVLSGAGGGSAEAGPCVDLPSGATPFAPASAADWARADRTVAALFSSPHAPPGGIVAWVMAHWLGSGEPLLTDGDGALLTAEGTAAAAARVADTVHSIVAASSSDAVRWAALGWAVHGRAALYDQDETANCVVLCVFPLPGGPAGQRDAVPLRLDPLIRDWEACTNSTPVGNSTNSTPARLNPFWNAGDPYLKWPWGQYDDPTGSCNDSPNNGSGKCFFQNALQHCVDDVVDPVQDWDPAGADVGFEFKVTGTPITISTGGQVAHVVYIDEALQLSMKWDWTNTMNSRPSLWEADGETNRKGFCGPNQTLCYGSRKPFGSAFEVAYGYMQHATCEFKLTNGKDLTPFGGVPFIFHADYPGDARGSVLTNMKRSAEFPAMFQATCGVLGCGSPDYFKNSSTTDYQDCLKDTGTKSTKKPEACTVEVNCTDQKYRDGFEEYWWPFSGIWTTSFEVIVVPRECITEPFVCSGHGECSPVWGCICNEGWGPPLFCTDCAPGYAGRDCKEQCPSTTCIPCSGHGRCSDGQRGDASCTCDYSDVLGYWDGIGCETCADGYFGTYCTQQCQQDAAARGINPVCGGDVDNPHGYCESGYAGRGICVCNPLDSSEPGVSRWDWRSLPAGCTDCVEGFWGKDCEQECPGGHLDPCSGHGECCDGVNGTGRCSCTNPGWRGNSCCKSCPGTSGTPGGSWTTCSGHGTCGDDGSCDCDPGWGTRNVVLYGPVHGWDPGCSKCSPGRGGINCTVQCGADPSAPELPCGGHGTCTDQGKCQCDTGWSENAAGMCVLTCDDGLIACSGHGTCVNATQCSCTGNWAWNAQSRSCTDCKPGWAGASCHLECPKDAGGAPCGGKGICVSDGNGTRARCFCQRRTAQLPFDYCGAACDISLDPAITDVAKKASCAPYLCVDENKWGPLCDKGCGVSGRGCGAYGYCDGGKDPTKTESPTGECFCKRGFGGSSCENSCPRATPSDKPGSGSLPCAGRGTCTLGGACQCIGGFVGAACDVACAGSYVPAGGATEAVPCSGHGECHRFDGSCTCDPGWYGDGCDRHCPGAVEDDSVSVDWRHYVREILTGSRWEELPDPLDSTSVKYVLEQGGTKNYTICTPCGGHGRCDITDVLQPVCKCHEGWRRSGTANDTRRVCSECSDDALGADCAHRCLGARSTVNSFGRILTETVDTLLKKPADCCTFRSRDGSGGGKETCLAAHGYDNSPVPDNWPTLPYVCQCPTSYGGLFCNATCNDPPCGKTATCIAAWKEKPWCNCTEDHWPPDVRNPDPALSKHGVKRGFCRRHCNASVCSPTQTCSPEGLCVCSDSDDTGHFTGAECDVCMPGWYGQKCDMRCPCSGHGECDSQGTICTCFGSGAADISNGRWQGMRCDRCMDGYTGADCTTINAAITYQSRLGSYPADRPTVKDPTVNEGLSEAMARKVLVDEDFKTIYAGGRTVSVVDGADANHHWNCSIPVGAADWFDPPSPCASDSLHNDSGARVLHWWVGASNRPVLAPNATREAYGESIWMILSPCDADLPNATIRPHAAALYRRPRGCGCSNATRCKWKAVRALPRCDENATLVIDGYPAESATTRDIPSVNSSICSRLDPPVQATVVDVVADHHSPVVYLAYTNVPDRDGKEILASIVVAASFDESCQASMDTAECTQVIYTRLSRVKSITYVRAAASVVVAGINVLGWGMQVLPRSDPAGWTLEASSSSTHRGEQAAPSPVWPNMRAVIPAEFCKQTGECEQADLLAPAAGASAVFVTLRSLQGVVLCRAPIAGGVVAESEVRCARVSGTMGSRAEAMVTDPYAEWRAVNGSYSYVPCLDGVDCMSDVGTPAYNEHVYVAVRHPPVDTCSPTRNALAPHGRGALVRLRYMNWSRAVEVDGLRELQTSEAPVAAMATRNFIRSLYLLPAVGGVRLETFLTYTVRWTNPRILTTPRSSDSLVLGVFGTGFRWIPGGEVEVNIGAASGERQYLNGSVINGTLIRLLLVGSSLRSVQASCEGQTVEVSLTWPVGHGNRRVTANSVSIDRAPRPIIKEAYRYEKDDQVTHTPAAVYIHTGAEVRPRRFINRTVYVTGINFRESDHLSCRWDPYRGGPEPPESQMIPDVHPYYKGQEGSWSYHSGANQVPPWWAVDHTADAPLGEPLPVVPDWGDPAAPTWSAENPVALQHCRSGRCTRIWGTPVDRHGLPTHEDWNSTAAREPAATYVSPTQILCLAPLVTNESLVVQLRVTLDGQIYSNPKDHWIVGSPGKFEVAVEGLEDCRFEDEHAMIRREFKKDCDMQCFEKNDRGRASRFTSVCQKHCPSGCVVGSADEEGRVARIPLIKVHVVDQRNNAVGILDEVRRIEMVASMPNPDSDLDESCRPELRCCCGTTTSTAAQVPDCGKPCRVECPRTFVDSDGETRNVSLEYARRENLTCAGILPRTSVDAMHVLRSKGNRDCADENTFFGAHAWCPGQLCGKVNITLEAGSGEVNSSLDFGCARAGPLKITFTSVEKVSGVRGHMVEPLTVFLRVLEGDAVALRAAPVHVLGQEPTWPLSCEIASTARGAPQCGAKIDLIDAMGNPVRHRNASRAAYENTVITAHVIAQADDQCASSPLCPLISHSVEFLKPVGRGVVHADDTATGVDVQLSPYHCVKYNVVFDAKFGRAQPDGRKEVTWVLASGHVTAQPCKDTYRGPGPDVPGEYSRCGARKCFPCPDLPDVAVCKGSKLSARYGYWRPKNSLSFYECTPPAACPGTESRASPCADGHKADSRLCSRCEDGYGRTRSGTCRKCQKGANTAMLVVFLLLFLLVFSGWSLYTMKKGKSTDKSVVLRMAFSHMQVAAAFSSLQIPWDQSRVYGAMKMLFRTNEASEMDPFSLETIACFSSGLDPFLVLILTMVTAPAMSVVVAGICYIFVKGYVWSTGQTDTSRKSWVRDAEDDAQRDKNELTSYRLSQMLLVVFVVVMFCLYQSIVSEAARRIRCRKMQDGYDEQAQAKNYAGDSAAVELFLDTDVPQESTVWVLSFDPDVQCDDADGRRMTGTAWAFLISYGIGTPVFLALAVVLWRRHHAETETQKVFCFLVGGFRRGRVSQLWQLVIMLRKFVVVVSLSLYNPEGNASADTGWRTKDRARVFYLMWLMTSVLLLQVYARPYLLPEHNVGEAVSLASMALTLTLSLLFFHSDGESDFILAMLDVLLVGMLLMNVAVMGMFVWLMVRAFKRDLGLKGDMGEALRQAREMFNKQVANRRLLGAGQGDSDSEMSERPEQKPSDEEARRAQEEAEEERKRAEEEAEALRLQLEQEREAEEARRRDEEERMLKQRKLDRMLKVEADPADVPRSTPMKMRRENKDRVLWKKRQVSVQHAEGEGEDKIIIAKPEGKKGEEGKEKDLQIPVSAIEWHLAEQGKDGGPQTLTISVEGQPRPFVLQVPEQKATGEAALLGPSGLPEWLNYLTRKEAERQTTRRVRSMQRVSLGPAQQQQQQQHGLDSPSSPRHDSPRASLLGSVPTEATSPVAAAAAAGLLGQSGGSSGLLGRRRSTRVGTVSLGGGRSSVGGDDDELLALVDPLLQPTLRAVAEDPTLSL
eukprot:TRINITY_DN2958_c0_g3_i1.p1 TRINITY_DN2958_c0_g3~~TRINITY_DN2958_c0_g3_i1.p1  ORF type:complete len:3630 (+),score=575.81 TRINITY_DN2958_c0_g3_i1:98-10891(+)